MDSIDVSIGLNATLQLLARYHQSGVLQAKMPHLPGLRGAGIGVIEVVGGKIVSCFIQNRKGNHRSLIPDKLTHFDMSRGPFEWRFSPYKPQESTVTTSLPIQTQPVVSKTRPPAGLDIPQTIDSLDVDTLAGFSPQQKRALRMTYTMINGRRTLDNIETHVPLSSGAMYEAVDTLVRMRVIVIHFQ